MADLKNNEQLRKPFNKVIRKLLQWQRLIFICYNQALIQRLAQGLQMENLTLELFKNFCIQPGLSKQRKDIIQLFCIYFDFHFGFNHSRGMLGKCRFFLENN